MIKRLKANSKCTLYTFDFSSLSLTMLRFTVLLLGVFSLGSLAVPLSLPPPPMPPAKAGKSE